MKKFLRGSWFLVVCFLVSSFMYYTTDVVKKDSYALYVILFVIGIQITRSIEELTDKKQ